jgi:hypothetical protein
MGVGFCDGDVALAAGGRLDTLEGTPNSSGEGDSALVDVDDDKQVVIRKQTATPAVPELAGASA